MQKLHLSYVGTVVEGSGLTSTTWRTLMCARTSRQREVVFASIKKKTMVTEIKPVSLGLAAHLSQRATAVNKTELASKN